MEDFLGEHGRQGGPDGWWRSTPARGARTSAGRSRTSARWPSGSPARPRCARAPAVGTRTRSAWRGEIRDGLSARAILAPPTELDELAALLRRAALVIASDTGPLHLAAALGTPALGLYGPTRAERNGPYGPHGRALQSRRPDHGRARSERGLRGGARASTRGPLVGDTGRVMTGARTALLVRDPPLRDRDRVERGGAPARRAWRAWRWADEIVVVDAESHGQDRRGRAGVHRPRDRCAPGPASRRRRTSPSNRRRATGSSRSTPTSRSPPSSGAASARSSPRTAPPTATPSRGETSSGAPWVRHGGLYPDYQLRLFRRRAGRFVGDARPRVGAGERPGGAARRALAASLVSRDLEDFVAPLEPVLHPRRRGTGSSGAGACG